MYLGREVLILLAFVGVVGFQLRVGLFFVFSQLFLFGVATLYISCIAFYILGNICFGLFIKKKSECLF